MAYIYSHSGLSQMEKAFAAGYDPALELAKRSAAPLAVHGDDHESDAISDLSKHLRRDEQDLIDRIVGGTETGHYYVFIGCKVVCTQWTDGKF